MPLPRGTASSCTNPTLDLYTSVRGALVDMAAVSFAIFDVSTAEKQAAPVKVYPEDEDRQDVDLAACPDGARLGQGHYVANWTPGPEEALGHHIIQWWFKLDDAGDEFTWSEVFDVSAQAQAGPGYCTVEDVRGEGVTEFMAADPRVERLIDSASREIDELTRWWHNPRFLTLRLDGRGIDRLYLPAPAIRIDSLEVNGVAYDVDTLTTYGAAPVKTPLQDAPALVWDRRFPVGRQNVVIVGLFGNTEDDGTDEGRVPARIRDACVLMVLKRALPAATDDMRNAHKIQSMRTRTQSVSFFQGAASRAPLTGDEEVDGILLLYRRPVALGAA